MGDTFSPSQAEKKTGLRFVSKNEPGEVSKRGRYRHTPRPYGAAKISPRSTSHAAIQELLDILSTNAPLLRECGVEEIKYYLTVSYEPSEEQCNLEFDVGFLKALGELGIPLLISI